MKFRLILHIANERSQC